MKSILTNLSIIMVIFIVACRYDKRDVPAISSTTFDTASCKDSVHFSTTLQPIINSTCTSQSGCHGHSPGAGANDFTTFSVIQADDSLIYTRIIMPTSNIGVGGFMPKGGNPLTQDQIQAFYCWWKQGGQNN